MGSGAIFAGTAIKILKSILDINGGAQILSSATDPTSSATSAPKGSVLLNTSNGNMYVKQDAGSSTNWTLIVPASSTNPTVQLFITPGSFTYTTPANVKWIEIYGVAGGGGGGGAQGAASGHAGTDGTDSTWAVHSGSVFVTLGHGSGAPNPGSNANGGAGGTNTIGSPASSNLLFSQAGVNGQGTSSSGTGASIQLVGGMGGSSYFGGAGSGGPLTATGYAAASNSGSGGGGGGTGTNNSSNPGAGGGAGGACGFIINSPSASYDIVVGDKGAGGAASTGCGGGGAAGEGKWLIIEHYNS